jgi:hypothetical protein
LTSIAYHQLCHEEKRCELRTFLHIMAGFVRNYIDGIGGLMDLNGRLSGGGLGSRFLVLGSLVCWFIVFWFAGLGILYGNVLSLKFWAPPERTTKNHLNREPRTKNQKPTRNPAILSLSYDSLMCCYGKTVEGLAYPRPD